MTVIGSMNTSFSHLLMSVLSTESGRKLQFVISYLTGNTRAILAHGLRYVRPSSAASARVSGAGHETNTL